MILLQPNNKCNAKSINLEKPIIFSFIMLCVTQKQIITFTQHRRGRGTRAFALRVS